MLIIGVDPGGILPGTTSGTGYAVLNTENMQIEVMREDNHTPQAFVGTLLRLQDEFPEAIMVYEGFKPRWGQKFELDSVYLIGALRTEFGERVPNVMPSVHMSAVPITKLTALMKSHGYKVRRGHARMALSVAVYYAAFVLREPTVLEFLADNN